MVGHGTSEVAPDRNDYVGLDVSHLFAPGSANPVRYIPLPSLNALKGVEIHRQPRPRREDGGPTPSAPHEPTHHQAP